MTKDDILRMAREAKLPDPMVFYASIERFTALVAAEVGIAQWHSGYAEGQAFEREQCADIVENADVPDCCGWTAQGIADAIRARSHT